MLQTLLIALIKVVAVLVFFLLNVLFLVYLERKISGFIQRRLGPMRVGKWGWAQTLADGLKLLLKEDVTPKAADKWLFLVAPIISFASALMVWVVVPFGPGKTGIVSDLNIGIIYIAAITSFSILSVFMSGWGSNNKYSLLGAMRGAAQMISYEVSLVMSILGVVMLAGSLSLQDIITAQVSRGLWFLWLQPLGFIIYLIAALAELNRTPFDLMEAESEIVAGYQTEFSGIRWGMFMMAEYGHLLSWSAIAAALFLGGWTGPTPADLPFVGRFFEGFVEAVPWLFPFFWFMLKTYVFVALAMWLRWTLPRVRIDQLMDLGWKFLLPVSIFNIALTGLLAHYWGWYGK